MIIFLHVNIMTLLLKSGTAKPQETSTGRQRLAKHFPVATDTNVTIVELLETMFSVRSVPKLCNHGCDQLTRSTFFMIFLGPRVNAELVSRFHVALLASHAGLSIVTSKFRSNVALPTLDQISL
jgi:hypothetical protein